MKKTLLLQTVNGIFVVFNEYDEEAQFEAFLRFLFGRLALKVPDVRGGPYSLLAESSFDGVPFTAMFHPETGCCIRLSDEAVETARRIILLCYGGAQAAS